MSRRTQKAPAAPMTPRLSSRRALVTKFEEECSRFKVGLNIQVARLEKFDGVAVVTGDHLTQLSEQARLINGLSLQIADAFQSTSTIRGKPHVHYRDLVTSQCRALLGILPELGAILREYSLRDARRVSDRLKTYLQNLCF
ncbi:hypothetical protein PENANT_c012G10050 [Penicillium antarcticum]|uniref:Uncharacterized protein n=1 Tax=Penicillium antarcticum TaxID=416450 RepID=A0A1V6Q6G3_9EURO|nr:uncharacterized protein N7508_008055 [Penicillium antarcticum]KAJ5297806.1 hypothetical protein N7508_008055 [Penicillium antarcticum]OQD84512.1 hypothetical protein PENANT_c012G10050 [Penicillium antarcticum]